MTIDLIVTWPTGCDFPIWRNFLRHNRERFENVFVIMSNSNTKHDYSSFLKGAFAKENVHFRTHDSYVQMEDWRNAAVNCGLMNSKADYVWFTEQDFFIHDPSTFFAQVHTAIKAGTDVLYIKQGDRIHPACLFVKRSVIEKTRKDFGIEPGKSDHFYKFVKDLEAQNLKMKEIDGEGKSWLHLNGLTHNYALIESQDPQKIQNVYQPGLFQLYNNYARIQQVEHDPYFINLTFQVDAYLSPICRFFSGK